MTETVAERVAVPGGRPATFRLRWKAPESFDLYRGSRKLGTARVEENGDWTARFDRNGKSWHAAAGSGEELLRLVGVFVLAHEAKEVPPAELDLPKEKVPAAERKLSAKWNDLQEKKRLEGLDRMIRKARERIVPVKR
jgi:hypothetical protein